MKNPTSGPLGQGRVVFVSDESPLHFGVALDRPENIWGILLAPADWDTRASDLP
jgi:hypothetical protein